MSKQRLAELFEKRITLTQRGRGGCVGFLLAGCVGGCLARLSCPRHWTLEVDTSCQTDSAPKLYGFFKGSHPKKSGWSNCYLGDKFTAYPILNRSRHAQHGVLAGPCLME